MINVYSWESRGVQYSFKYHLGYDIFQNLYFAYLLGGKYPNTYGVGSTEIHAVESLKLRLIQLRNKYKYSK